MPKYRGHLIDHVVDTLGCEREFAEDAVHAVERGVTELTAGDEQLLLKGFGTFSLRHRRPSTTRSEETTSELQTIMRLPYAVLSLATQKTTSTTTELETT